MKILKQFRNLIRENERSMNSPQKHDANLQKNSTLYFQVGLIVCLLAAYGVLEMKFLNEPTIVISDPYDPDKDTLFAMSDFQIYVEPVKKQVIEAPVEPRPIIDKINVLPDTPLIGETPTFTPESAPPIVTNQNPNKVTEIKKEDNKLYNTNTVEKIPVFPGCESERTNESRKACFESKISTFISRKFNSNIASTLGLEGVQRIYVQFRVDKNGEIVDIKTRAPHPALEKEAFRIVDKLPKMIPGMQGDIPVSVVYSIPITFQVNN